MTDTVIYVTAGQCCPNCDDSGLFKWEFGWLCESCVTHFDEDFNEMSGLEWWEIQPLDETIDRQFLAKVEKWLLNQP